MIFNMFISLCLRIQYSNSSKLRVLFFVHIFVAPGFLINYFMLFFPVLRKSEPLATASNTSISPSKPPLLSGQQQWSSTGASHTPAGSTRFSSISTPGAKASLSDEEIAMYNSLLTQAKSKLHSERERAREFSLSA